MKPQQTEFEIYPSGDPYSHTWDCSEGVPGEDTATYRGDISGRFAKRGLIWILRRHYPGTPIRYRESGRLCRIGLR